MDEKELDRRLTQYIGMSALGDFLILIGLFFVFLGTAEYLTEYIGVKGSGEVGIGVFLVGAAFAIFFIAWRILAGPPEIAPKEKKSG